MSEGEAAALAAVADAQRILIFNVSQTVDFANGDAILPVRITCYCRHHHEKTGFWYGRVRIVVRALFRVSAAGRSADRPQARMFFCHRVAPPSVNFVLRDHLNQVVATGVSPPIMITDDHKSARSRTKVAGTQEAAPGRRAAAAVASEPDATPSPTLPMDGASEDYMMADTDTAGSAAGASPQAHYESPGTDCVPHRFATRAGRGGRAGHSSWIFRAVARP